MGVAPDRCLVFEDGEPGIAAARRAAMGFVRVLRR
jgi:beta-phosphoglucomutase-like phosphatase (HAD superfamily)